MSFLVDVMAPLMTAAVKRKQQELLSALKACVQLRVLSSSYLFGKKCACCDALDWLPTRSNAHMFSSFVYTTTVDAMVSRTTIVVSPKEQELPSALKVYALRLWHVP